MHWLVTAGNTLTPIDRVRGITNIFTGKTGTRIALAAVAAGHTVTLLTSHPHLLVSPPTGLTVVPYRTFADLAELLPRYLTPTIEVLVHSAAVSDYETAGIFAPADGTTFDPTTAHWQGTPPTLADRASGKVKSDEPELWLRLTRTPKLVDCVRRDWGFAGVLVKFKLEVGIDEPTLLAIAERSRVQSAADLMVANTLDGATEWAYLGPNAAGGYDRIARSDLESCLIAAVTQLHAGR